MFWPGRYRGVRLICRGDTMRTINSFAAAVHRLRRARGMSLGDIAAKTGYSPSYVSKVLHGHRRLQSTVVSEIDKVLDAEGELVRIALAQAAGASAPARPMQLPSVGADFVGREDFLRRMDEAVITQDRPGAATTMVIEGGVWVGKTALALQWAARVQERFPGGCLFADLRGLAPGKPADPGEVLDAFLRALGAGADAARGSVADRAARYRSLLAARPAVVVLDNIASYAQVQHLLPGAGSAVVVTSREHQSVLLLRSGGLLIDLPPLTLSEALVLLRRRLGDARVDVDLAAAEAVAHRCGRLPMALLIVAEHLQQCDHGSLSRLADDLAIEERRLDLFTSPDPSVNIHGVIDLSYLALPRRAARVFRLLGICPAHLVSDESTAALTGLSVADARDALRVLRQAHLLDGASSGRLRMNDLLRAYARQKALVEESLSEVDRARDRVVRWYVATAWAAGDVLAPHWSGTALAPNDATDIAPLTFDDTGYDAALAWCEAEADTAIRIARHARSHRARDAEWILPTLFLPYFYVSRKWATWLTAATEGLAAARASGSRHGMAWTLLSLGWVQHELGRTDEAATHLRDGLRLCTDLEDDRLRGWTSIVLGLAYRALGRHHEARSCFDLADHLFAALDFGLGLAVTGATLAHVHQASGETDAASEAGYDAVVRAQKVRSAPVISLAHHQLGLLLLQQDQYGPALTHLDSALTLRRRSHERWAEAGTLIARAEVFSKLHEPKRARESYREAATILETLRDPRALEIQAKIAALNTGMASPDDRAT